LKDRSIWLIKWQKEGLENLFGSPYIKRRIRRRAIRDYRRNEHQNPSYLFNAAPTKSEEQAMSDVGDYGEKCE